MNSTLVIKFSVDLKMVSLLTTEMNYCTYKNFYEINVEPLEPPLNYEQWNLVSSGFGWEIR